MAMEEMGMGDGDREIAAWPPRASLTGLQDLQDTAPNANNPVTYAPVPRDILSNKTRGDRGLQGDVCDVS